MDTLDKIFGRCLLEDLCVQDWLIVTSGRLPSEIIPKIAKRGRANHYFHFGPHRLGHQRGSKMNVYSHDLPWLNLLIDFSDDRK